MNEQAAAAYPAVLVDGVGHTQEMVIHRSVDHLLIPIRTAAKWTASDQIEPLCVPAATFVRLGKLQDGRVVYGQDTAHLQIWTLDTVVTAECKSYAKIDISRVDLENWLKQCGKPALCLHESKVFDEDTNFWRYHFEGVGVNTDAKT